MILPDVNVLIYAHRKDSPNHSRYREWLTEILDGDQGFGMSDLVLSAFLRIVTNPKVFREPDPIGEAVAFTRFLRDRENCLLVEPGTRHWQIFTDLCESLNATGNAIPDAYLAALAIESGSQWVTTDRGFARFPGLRWRLP